MNEKLELLKYCGFHETIANDIINGFNSQKNTCKTIEVVLFMKDGSQMTYNINAGYASKYIKNAMDLSITENRIPKYFVIGGKLKIT